MSIVKDVFYNITHLPVIILVKEYGFVKMELYQVGTQIVTPWGVRFSAR